MIELDVNYVKARVWIRDLPNINSSTIDKKCISIYADKNTRPESFCVAMELLLAPREISNYALLGARYTPEEGSALEISVNISDDADILLEDTISLSCDEVRTGIPRVYAETVVKTAQRVLSEINSFPAGRLEFCIGAHGLVGSSEEIFSKITGLIIKTMYHMTSESYAEDLKEFIENELAVV